MRKNLASVLFAFQRRERGASGSVSTDGVTIYSYMFPIARRVDDGNVWLIESYPSRTTQSAINSLAAEFPEARRVKKL